MSAGFRLIAPITVRMDGTILVEGSTYWCEELSARIGETVAVRVVPNTRKWVQVLSQCGAEFLCCADVVDAPPGTSNFITHALLHQSRWNAQPTTEGIAREHLLPLGEATSEQSRSGHFRSGFPRAVGSFLGSLLSPKLPSAKLRFRHSAGNPNRSCPSQSSVRPSSVAAERDPATASVPPHRLSEDSE